MAVAYVDGSYLSVTEPLALQSRVESASLYTAVDDIDFLATYSQEIIDNSSDANAWNLAYEKDGDQFTIYAERVLDDDNLEEWNKWAFGEDIDFAFGLAFINPEDGTWINLISPVITIGVDETPNEVEIEASPWMWIFNMPWYSMLPQEGYGWWDFVLGGLIGLYLPFNNRARDYDCFGRTFIVGNGITGYHIYFD